MIQNLFIDIFAHPFVCYILLMLGMYLLLFGIASEEDEMIVGGAVCLGFSIIGSAILDIDPASVILFIVGIILFIAEAGTEGSFDGIVAIGGIICVIGGDIFFIQSLTIHIGESLIVVMWATLLTFTMILAVIFGGITFKVIEIKKKREFDKFNPEQGGYWYS
ncbi:MAG: hypothetical protein ACFFD2_21850 [Promethearchaeota archaeon]